MLRKKGIATEKDRLQRAIEETNLVVNTTVNTGTFERRVPIEDKKDEWRDLAISINTLFESILTPFNVLNNIINSLSTGDLTPRIHEEFKGDSATIVQNLNSALDSLTGFIRAIATSIQDIEDVSIGMKNATEELNVITNEISTAIGQMGSGTKQQLERVDQSFQLTEDVLKFSGEMNKLSRSINETAIQGSKKSIDGRKIVAHQNTVMDEIGSISSESANSIRQLEKRSKEISSVIGIIKEVTTQTNLLALNAAIEAAQAGDAGRGFAVVAAEIRKLAEDSRRSAVLIEELITGIQTETSSTVSLMEKMSKSVSQGITASNETNTALEHISELYGQTVEASNQISNATEEQTLNIRRINQTLEEVVVTSEETASGAEQIHLSSKRVSETMENFLQRTVQNLETVKDLKKQSSNFKID